ncbi:MAG: hypothetical protein ACKO38_04265, partial [Planctomycetota bacterium]
MRISSTRHRAGDMIRPVVCGARRAVLPGRWTLSPARSKPSSLPVALVMLGISVGGGAVGCSIEYKETTPVAENASPAADKLDVEKLDVDKATVYKAAVDNAAGDNAAGDKAAIDAAIPNKLVADSVASTASS